MEAIESASRFSSTDINLDPDVVGIQVKSFDIKDELFDLLRTSLPFFFKLTDLTGFDLQTVFEALVFSVC